MTEYDVDLYFALVEKMMVFDGGRLTASLLDSTATEHEIELRRSRLGWLLTLIGSFIFFTKYNVSVKPTLTYLWGSAEYK